MPTYYSLNSRRIRLSEYRPRTSWAAMPLVLLLKLLRVRFEGSADDPPVDSLAEFESALEAWPDDICDIFSDDVEVLRTHGFGVRFAHFIETPVSRTTLYRLTLAAPSGKITARLQVRVWMNAGKRTLRYSRQLTTLLHDGARRITATEDLVVGSSPPGINLGYDLRQPGFDVRHLSNADLKTLWEAHERRIETVSAREIQPVATEAELRASVEQEHAIQVQARIERGLCEALPQVPEVPQDSPHAPMLAELFKISQRRVTWKSALGSLVLSLAAFIAVAYWQKDSAALIAIIPILFIHELGHWVAMKAFGYQQTRMLFLPFFGAAVAGRQLNAAGWKKVIVSLMGPLPGIGLGCVLGAVALFLKEMRVLDVALTLLALNTFNLLPVLPLDGGQVMQSLLFCRHRYLDLLFRLVAILGVFALYIFADSKVFLFIGISMCLALKTTYAMAKTSEELRQEPDLDTVSPDGISVPVDTACHIADALRPKLNPALAPKFLAAHVLSVFETLNARPPGIFATISLFGTYLSAVSVGIAASAIFFLARTNNGDFLGIAAMAADRPKLAYVCGQSRSLQPEGAMHLQPETLMASFENASLAQASFEKLSNQRVPGRQVLFGQMILIRIPRDTPELRTTLETQLKAAGGTTQITHPRTAHVRFAAIATSAEKAAEFQKQIADYNPLPRFMSLLPPWSVVWRRAPQREAWQQKRNVLLELIKQDVVPDIEQTKALQKELTRAYRRRDRVAAKEANRMLRDLQRAAWRESLEKDLDARVDPLERDLVSAWLAWKLESFDRGQEGFDELDWMPGPEERELTPAEARLRELAAHLGQEAGVAEIPATEATSSFNRYVHVQHEGLMLSISLTAFDPLQDMPDITDWFCAKRCEDILYELTGRPEPFDELEDDEDE